MKKARRARLRNEEEGLCLANQSAHWLTSLKVCLKEMFHSLAANMRSKEERESKFAYI